MFWIIDKTVMLLNNNLVSMWEKKKIRKEFETERSGGFRHMLLALARFSINAPLKNKKHPVSRLPLSIIT